mmetsp:Transcript_1984/g.4298  ORF Transcript_1984/g.4298 Transcript_1984/m.4298 type:complete len:667 (+) Transcript_1984:338-2338(+)
MLFPFVNFEASRNTLLLQGRVHELRLVGRHNFVFVTLQQQNWTRERVDALDGGPFLVDRFVLRIPSHEPVQIPALKLVGVPREGAQVPDAVQTTPGREHVAKRQRPQGRVSPRAAPVDAQPLRIRETLPHQMLRSRAHVVDIHDAPAPTEPAAVVPSVARRPPVVHVEDGEAAARPELNARVEGGGGARRGSPVRLDQQRRCRLGGAGEGTVGRGVVVAEGAAQGRGKFHLHGRGDHVGRELKGGGRREPCRGGAVREGPPKDPAGGVGAASDHVQVVARRDDAAKLGRQAVGHTVFAEGGRGPVAGHVGDQEHGVAVLSVGRVEASVVEKSEGLLSEPPAGRRPAEIAVHGYQRFFGAGAVDIVVSRLVRNVVERSRLGMPHGLEDGGVPVASGHQLVVRRVRRSAFFDSSDAQLRGIPGHVGVVPRDVRHLLPVRRDAGVRIKILACRQHLHCPRSVRSHRCHLVHHLRGSRILVVLAHRHQPGAVHRIELPVGEPPPSPVLGGHRHRIPAARCEAHETLRRKLRVVHRPVGTERHRPPAVLVHARPRVGAGGGHVHGPAGARGGIVGSATAQDVAPALLRAPLEPQQVAVVRADEKIAQGHAAGGDGFGGDGARPGAVGGVRGRGRGRRGGGGRRRRHGGTGDGSGGGAKGGFGCTEASGGCS